MAFAELVPDGSTLDSLAASLEGASAAEIVRWAVSHWTPGLVLTCSFGGASGMVLLDLALRENRDLPVLVLDTGLLFSETYSLIDVIEQHYGIHVQRVQPALSVAAQDAAYGPTLYGRDPDLCCKLRKVEPLQHALKGYRAWMTAIRRDQSPTRSNTPIVSWNAKHGLVKVAPLARWTERDIWRYVAAHGVPYNPLLDQGYPSLGCQTCTRLPTGADPRSGRWAGFAKTECGLHT